MDTLGGPRTDNRSGGVFVPLLLTLLALLVWFGFQTTQLVAERRQAGTLRADQTPVFENAERLRGQLDALATGTQRLADAGNANARAITTALAQQGITITPHAGAGTAR